MLLTALVQIHMKMEGTIMPRMSPMPIPIPHNTPGGRINTRTNGYVYWTTKTWWDNETKNAKDNRKLIGKVLPDDETMMRPNKWYIENLSYLFEEQHILSHPKLWQLLHQGRATAKNQSLQIGQCVMPVSVNMYTK